MTKPFILGLAPRTEDALLSMNEIHDAVGDNTGNLAFAHAIHAHIGGNVECVKWSDSVELINKTGTLAVLPAANQLGKHCDFSGLAEKLKHVTVPIVTMGLGAQSDLQGTIPDIPKGTVHWVRCLADHAPSDSPSIGVRGMFTMEVLDHLGFAAHATVIGCPSLFINPMPTLGKEVAQRLRTPERIAVIAGNQHWQHLRRIEESLARLVTETNGSYIGQEPLEMMTLTRGLASSMDDASLRQCRDYIHPNMEIKEFIDWIARHGNIFFDVPHWIEHYQHFDFVIGMRIHGTILGIQAGVPSVCIVHDSRTLELCETLKIPHVLATDVLDGIDCDDLVYLFDFDAIEFDRNRRALCRRYVEFLWSNGLIPAQHLENIANYYEECPVTDSG